MNQEMPKNLNPEDQEWSNEEKLEQWFIDHPEPVISPENLRECGPEITEFEGMLIAFESTHSLAELNSIIDLKPEESRMHPVREPARLGLIPIVTKLNILKKETNISDEKHKELNTKYRILSKAVGMINNDKVDHNR